MNAADATVADAVAAVSSQIAAAIDAIADRMLAGGRLVYVGAGSSGRIAALDASECEATFSTSPGAVIALVAGGQTASPLVQAAAEDDRARRRRRDLGAPAQRRRLRRGRQRQRCHAVRPRCARLRRSRRRADRLRGLRAGLRARLERRPRDCRHRRARVPRRLDPAESGHGTEARAQHDLDRFDDPTGQDIRESHGRRRGREREARGTRAADRRRRERCVEPERSTTPSPRPGETLASRSCRSSRRSTPTRRALASTASGRSIARALESAT